MTRPLAALCALVLAALPLAAQEPTPVEAPAALMQEAVPTAAAAAPEAEKAEAKYDFITPHITDGPHLEVPWFAPPFYKEIHLPHFEPVQVGPFLLDLSPTKHVIFMIFAAVLASLVLILGARSHARATAQGGTPKGFGAAIESVVLYLRNEVVLPNVGHHGEGFVPICLSFFFFILFANLLGLVPWGATATGNISVTATLALLAFITIEIAGMRAQGLGYIKTIIYWPSDMPLFMKVPLSLILTPVEIIGKFTKPFALAIRLFANMTAGHVVLLAILGLVFTFQSWAIAPLPVAMSVAIMMLELLVAFLQAFVFTLLVSVFIGQIREHH
jgi:F-type H+-transporting ATPase subunit a